MAISINGSTGISGVNGSAATPAIQGGDSDTGIFFGTDTASVATEGIERLIVDANGNINIDSGGVFYDATNNRLAIGTTTPDFTLDVNGSIGVTEGGVVAWHDTSGNLAARVYGTSTDELRFEIGSGGSRAMTIDSSGRLLVGTSSSSSNGRLIVQGGTSTSTGNLYITNTGSTPADGEGLGVVRFADNSHVSSAMIFAARDGGTWTSGVSQPSHLVFSTTADGAAGPTTRMTIHNTGELRMGTTEQAAVSTDPVHTLGDVSIDTVQNNLARLIIQERTSNWISFKGGSGAHNGTISVSGGGVNYGSNSDYRLKENIVSLTNAISRVKQLAPKRFNFIAKPEITVDGFLAHEAQAVVPEAVTGTHNEIAVWEDTDILPEGVSVGDDKLDENGNTIPVMQGMDQSKLVPVLTAALQEAIAKIETLEAKVAALEAN